MGSLSAESYEDKPLHAGYDGNGKRRLSLSAVPYAENPEVIHIYKTDAEGYKEAIDIISSVDSSNLSEKTQDMNSLIERMNDKYDLNNRPDSSWCFPRR